VTLPIRMSLSKSLAAGLAGIAALSVAAYAYARLNCELAKKRQARLGLPYLPGSFPLGNAIRMGKDGQIEFYRDLRELVLREAPKRCLGTMTILNDVILVCYRPAHAHAILRDSTVRTAIRIFDVHLKRFLGPQAIIMLMDQPWKNVRTVLLKAFKNSDMNSMSLTMAECAWQFADKLAEVKTVDFLTASKGCTLDIIGRTAFGYDFGGIRSLGAGGNAVGNAFQFLLDDVTDRQFRPTLSKMLYWLPNEQNRRHHESIKILRGTVDAIVAERTSSSTPGAKDLLGSMLLACEEGGAFTALSKDALTDNLLTFMFGGFDTTSIALTYALFLLAENPAQWTRLRLEVDSVLEPRGQLSMKELKSLPFCTKVVKETLRLYPPAPLTARTTTSSVDLDGYIVEKGTRVMIPMWWVHRDAEVWPEPDKFDPDRFDKDPPPGAWIPFSDGLRNCVGYRFAMAEATIMLAVLVRALTWKIEAGYTLTPKNTGVVQVPAGGLPLIFETRAD